MYHPDPRPTRTLLPLLATPALLPVHPAQLGHEIGPGAALAAPVRGLARGRGARPFVLPMGHAPLPLTTQLRARGGGAQEASHPFAATIENGLVVPEGRLN